MREQEGREPEDEQVGRDLEQQVAERRQAEPDRDADRVAVAAGGEDPAEQAQRGHRLDREPQRGHVQPEPDEERHHRERGDGEERGGEGAHGDSGPGGGDGRRGCASVAP